MKKLFIIIFILQFFTSSVFGQERPVIDTGTKEVVGSNAVLEPDKFSSDISGQEKPPIEVVGVKKSFYPHGVFTEDYPKILGAIKIIDNLIQSGDTSLVDLKISLESMAKKIKEGESLFNEVIYLDEQMQKIAGDKETTVRWMEEGTGSDEFKIVSGKWKQKEEDLHNFAKSLIDDIELVIENVKKNIEELDKLNYEN